MQDAPYSLLSELEKVAGNGHPPVHLWNPDNEQDIDLVIKQDGTWFYNGSPIKRRRLVRLFSSVLRKDDEDYFLVTPVEKCRITVEDAPFQGVLLETSGKGEQQEITITTDMAERVVVDEDHPLRVEQKGEEWIPYLLVRDGMEARVARNVYYQLAEMLSEKNGELGIWSSGEFFPFMKADD